LAGEDIGAIANPPGMWRPANFTRVEAILRRALKKGRKG